VLLLAACGKEPQVIRDLGLADRLVVPGDLGPLSESGLGPLVDFVVQGCAELVHDTCSGPAPLALTFSAVTSSEVTGAKWDLGDGAPPETGAVVEHTYQKPGTYTVTLALSAASGTVSEQKRDFVVVQPAGPGAACTADVQCRSGSCICREGCPVPLPPGLCLEECEKVACVAGSVCVDLAQGGAAPDAWRRLLCLPSCTSDASCARPDFSCRLLPGVGGWQPACWPAAFPRFIGEVCRTAAGATDPSACIGRLCLDIGASGYCSAVCTASSPCPEGARCARFNQDPAAGICLLRCAPSACVADPQLACEEAGGSGAFGFQIDGPAEPAGTRYCAPKRCTSDQQCGLTGRCDLGKGGYCRPAT
jgi:PKD repeat protein